MKLTAKIRHSGKKVVVKPILFGYYVGVQYKELTGPGSGSIFCSKKQEFIFPWYGEILIFFIHIYHWLTKYAYMYLRYWLPNRIKYQLSRKKVKLHDDDLPF